jgi:hypothetical protein
VHANLVEALLARLLAAYVTVAGEKIAPVRAVQKLSKNVRLDLLRRYIGGLDNSRFGASMDKLAIADLLIGILATPLADAINPPLLYCNAAIS